MSEKDRSKIKIESIFQSKNTNAQLLYIQCQTTEDISQITSHLKNLPNSNLKTNPSTVNFIPQCMYKRFQYCEKLLYKLRLSQDGQIQTNIRLGRIDFQLRHRKRGDDTPWKEIPMLQIPRDAPPPQTDLMDPIDVVVHQQQEQNAPNTISSRLPTFNVINEEQLTDTSGSVSNQLRNKHSISPSIQT